MPLIGRAATTVAGALLLLSGLLTGQAASVPGATNGSVLFYGPTTPYGSLEVRLVRALGMTPVIADAATWRGLNRQQLRRYEAIVFPDPGCAVTPRRLRLAAATRDHWSKAVEKGNIAILGTDAAWHHRHGQAAATARLTRNGLAFATSGRKTGLFFSLSCYYYSAPRGTAVTALAGLGQFTVRGQDTLSADCLDDVSIVAPDHPLVRGLTGADLSNWGCAAHEVFTRWPADYEPVATVETFPYIVAKTGH